MGDAGELLAVVDSVAAALRHVGVPYFITGSLASSVHGEFRATNDVDIVAALGADALAPLFAALGDQFVADPHQAREALAMGASFNLIHRGTFLKVDFFPCTSPHDREAIARARPVEVPGAAEPLQVATAEDIILAKLRWYRLGGESSEVQRRDVRQLIALNRERLDLAYLRRWAASLEVADLLRGIAGIE